MSDLDARVAALMKLAYKFRRADAWDEPESAEQLYQAIRAELQKPTSFIKERAQLEAEWVELKAMRGAQKPALHELVTDAETDKALQMFNVVGGDNRTRIRRTLSHFLQGRAKPAQEFYCNKCGYFGPNQTHQSCGYLAVPLSKSTEPAQEEITDVNLAVGYTGGTCVADSDGGLIRLYYKTGIEADAAFAFICKKIDAVIRASKGEKT